MTWPDDLEQETGKKPDCFSVVTNCYSCLGKLFHLEQLHWSNNVKVKSNQIWQTHGKYFLKGSTIQIDLKQEKHKDTGRRMEEQKIAHLLVSGPYFPIEI